MTQSDATTGLDHLLAPPANVMPIDAAARKELKCKSILHLQLAH
jgi:hypothetical protein